MTTRDDRGFESLLERGLREGAAPAGACPDPELLAGYLERSLSGEEAKRCETHFATCLRCQEELAAIVGMKAEPARRTLSSWLRLPAVRWVAPLAAGATAVLALSVAIRLAPQGQVPSFETAASRPKEPVKEPQALERKAAPAAEAPKSAALPRGTVGQPPAAPLAAHKAAPPPAAAPAPSRQESADRSAMLQRAPAAPLEDQVAGGARAKASPAEPKGESPQFRAREAPAPESDRFVADEYRKESGRLEHDAGRPARAQRRDSPSVAAEGMMATATGPAVFSPPDGSPLWRLGPPGTIERSADGGHTWEAQPTGVDTELLSGSCPAESVCWVVGRNGTVLRTTDGRSWQRLGSPTGEDLVRVRANDASAATVVTAGGSEIRTDDGGRNWQTAEP